MCLPGPAPPVDLSRYVHVSGFPSTARTDAIMRPIKAVDGCEALWFHWIDDKSGVAECKSAEGVTALLEAAAAAAAAAASANGDASAGDSTNPAAEAAEGEAIPRVVDPTKLLLEDMKLAQMDRARLLNGGRTPEKEGEEVKMEVEEKVEEQGGEKRGAKRPRQEDDNDGAAAEKICA